MAEVIKYVDSSLTTGSQDGSDWANAYHAISSWELNENTNLVSAGDWHHCLWRSSLGTVDTTSLEIIGWTTGINNYILIDVVDGYQAVKTSRDTSRCILNPTRQGDPMDKLLN